MSDPRRCPQCDAEIPANSPAGLCPRCLLKASADSQSAAASVDPGPTKLTPPNSGFEPPTVEELAPLFPQLEILELLGKGGMGAVYKARQPGLDRQVALKILPPEISRDPSFAERFQREARALAKLNHPHIVAVYDFGQTLECGARRGSPDPAAGSTESLPSANEPQETFGQSGGSVGDRPQRSDRQLCYIVMEFIDGTNLRQTIKAGKLAPAEALAIVPQICEALQFAHDEGVVHRDIKPENILIDKRGRVKIADFGLAKLLGSHASDHSLTATHQVMGTLRYMAPEQMQGSREVDHRADIYSLGVVFYELLTGELPMGKFAPPSRKVHIDVRLDEVVLRALEQDPEQRYQHASEVKSEIDTIRTSAVPQKPAETKDPLEPFRELARFAGTSLTQMRFAVPAAMDVARQANFYFLSHGYQLVERQSDVCVFQRGRKWEGFWSTDIRKYATRLTVRTALAADGQRWVSCDWSVQTMGAWITRRNIRQLEAEGDGFKSFLGVASSQVGEERDPATRSSESLITAGRERCLVPADCLLLAAGIAFVTACGVVLWMLAVLGTSNSQYSSSITRGNLIRMSAGLAMYSVLIGIAGLMLRRLRARLVVLLVTGIVGLFFPAVAALNVVMELRNIPQWPVVIPLWLGVPVAFWVVVTLFRADVRRAFDAARAASKLSGELGGVSPQTGGEDVRGLTSANSPSLPAQSPKLVPVFAMMNLLGAIVLMLVCAMEDSASVAESVPRIWQVWEKVDAVLGFTMAAGMFAASIGLFLWKPWARKLTLGVCIFGLASFVFDAPYLSRFAIPDAYSEIQNVLITEGVDPETRETVAMLAVVTLIGGVMLVGLAWLIGQLVYFTRPRVVAAFASPNDRPNRFLDWLFTGAGVIVGVLSVFGPIALLIVIATLFNSLSSSIPSAKPLLPALPPLGTITNGIGAEFRVPAGQVAVLEIVTRRDGETVPVPPHCGYVIAPSNRSLAATFRWSRTAEQSSSSDFESWDLEIKTAGGGGGFSGGLQLPKDLSRLVGSKGIGMGDLAPNEEVIHWSTHDANNLPDNGLIGLRVTVTAHGLETSGGSGNAHIDWKKSQSATSTTRRKLSADPLDSIHRAAELGDATRVKQLLDGGASINAKDAGGQTPLMKAVAGGHRSLALTLVLLGANLTEQDQRGQTAIMIAAEKGDATFLSKLHELSRISFEQNATTRKEKLRAFPGIERALLAGRDFDLHLLAHYDAEKLTDENGENALMKAARVGSWECASELTTHVDTMLARDKLGRTVLMHAVLGGHAEEDAWLERFEWLTKPPYFGVAGEDNLYVGAMLLFELERSLSVLDKDRKSLLQIAEAHGDTRIAEILRRHLQMIIVNQTAEIEKGGNTVRDHYRLRALAWQALVEKDKAEADFKKQLPE